MRLITLGAAFIALLGLFLLFQDDAGAKVFGLVWIAAFSALAIAFWRRARGVDAVVIVNDQGIFDRRLSSEIIPWDAVSSVETLEAETMF